MVISMRKFIILISVVFLTGCVSLAPKLYPEGKGSDDIATFNKFTRVEVIGIKYVENPVTSKDKQICFNIERKLRSSMSKTTAVVAGGLVGGLAANKLAKNTSSTKRKVATAAGAALGATVTDYFSVPDHIPTNAVGLGLECLEPGADIEGDYYNVSISKGGRTLTYRTRDLPKTSYIYVMRTIYRSHPDYHVQFTR